MKKKTFLAAVAIALVAILSLGTLAYFTDVTDEAENMFVVKGTNPDEIFSATLTEPAWDAYQDKEDGKAVIKPGVTIDKDPTITLTGDSYNYGAWIAMKVIVSGVPYDPYDVSSIKTLFKDLTDDGLSVTMMLRTEEEVAAGTQSFLFTWRPTTPLALNESATIFTGVVFPADMDATELAAFKDFKITAKGYAVSAEELTYDESATPLNELITANP